jgi:hypothetical protein
MAKCINCDDFFLMTETDAENGMCQECYDFTGGDDDTPPGWDGVETDCPEDDEIDAIERGEMLDYQHDREADLYPPDDGIPDYDFGMHDC